MTVACRAGERAVYAALKPAGNPARKEVFGGDERSACLSHQAVTLPREDENASWLRRSKSFWAHLNQQ